MQCYLPSIGDSWRWQQASRDSHGMIFDVEIPGVQRGRGILQGQFLESGPERRKFMLRTQRGD